ncbi:MAG: DUF262 domain-containing protein [Candidatus Methylomirabilota bacterium]
MPSLLEQYRITDFLDWQSEKRLVLNPNFQRGSVWTPAARTYLIDTILRQLPIPKVYLRTSIDVATKKTIREVVDGQQRLRAIIDFAADKLALSKRAGEFSGLRYSTLTAELQERFLSYAIAVDQLVNASDDDVLEVFARLNSYSVALNPAEKRHAKFQGEFKWAVRAASRKWAILWETLGLLTVRERVRMLDDSLTAEMFGILMEGVRDGGQNKIDSLYKRHDGTFPADGDVPSRLDMVLDYFVQKFAEALRETPLMRPPHFLMLFAALAHVLVGIPKGDLLQEPVSPDGALTNLEQVVDNLRVLGSLIDSGAVPSQYEAFWKASTASTQRISSRRIRFSVFLSALAPSAL